MRGGSANGSKPVTSSPTWSTPWRRTPPRRAARSPPVPTGSCLRVGARVSYAPARASRRAQAKRRSNTGGASCSTTSSTAPMSTVVIRPAQAEDAATLLRLIRELAEFEKLAHEVRASEADLIREGFGPVPRYEALLAELDGSAVGFALFFHNYSTFTGRAGLYLEDIFITETARGHGIGRQMMASPPRIAGQHTIAPAETCVR